MTIEERIIEAYENIGTIAAAKRSYHPLTANKISNFYQKIIKPIDNRHRIGYNHYNIKQLMWSAWETVLRIEIFVGFIKIKEITVK